MNSAQDPQKNAKRRERNNFSAIQTQRQHDTCTSTCDCLQMHFQIFSFLPMGEAVGGTRQNFIAMFHYY